MGGPAFPASGATFRLTRMAYARTVFRESRAPDGGGKKGDSRTSSPLTLPRKAAMLRTLTLLAVTASACALTTPAVPQEAETRDGDAEENLFPRDGAEDREKPLTVYQGPGNQDWQADQAVGRTYAVTMDGLSEPYEGPAVRNSPVIVPRDGAAPNLPEGFEATLYAEGLERPRQVLALPNGDVIVVIQRGGYLVMMRDDDGDGRADYVERHAAQFNNPYGVEHRDGEIVVADQDALWTIAYDPGQLRPPFAQAQRISETTPRQRQPGKDMDGQTPLTAQGVFGLVQGHYNRDVAIGPDGTIYVGVGSVGNIGEEPEPKSTIQAFGPDGTNQRTVASGMRNPSGVVMSPEGRLWAVVQERDGLGDQLVPDFFTEVEEGGFYGFPYSYIGQNPQPGFAGKAPELVERAIEPDLLFTPHSAAMDAVFYEGGMFPDAYDGDAFVALKGSWNSSEPTGYKVVRARFEDGEPTGEYENFATGFWRGGTDKARVWGRPVDVEVGPDGALFILDEPGGTLWRVTYEGDGR